MMALWQRDDAEMSLGASLLHVISLFVSEPATPLSSVKPCVTGLGFIFLTKENEMLLDSLKNSQTQGNHKFMIQRLPELLR